MKLKIMFSALLVANAILLPRAALAMGGDDPLLFGVDIDKLEKRDTGDEHPLAWEVSGWAGYDLEKVVLKSSGERVNGETESAEFQLLYSKAIDPYWNLQTGIRYDSEPESDKKWVVLGVEGLAPYFIETDANLYIGEDGQVGVGVGAEYEIMLTQRWVLSPNIEFNLFSKADRLHDTGAGLSDMELGLRLRYEVKREFAPYIGVNWERKFGQTASFTKQSGGDSTDAQLVMGIKAWF